MTHHRSNQDSRKAKEGSRRQSNRPQTASSSQRENRSGSSSSRTSTSQPSGSSSSSGRRHSSHRSSEEYSETYSRASQHGGPVPLDFASMNAEHGSRGSYVDENRAAAVGYASWERRLDAERHPGVTYDHDQPRYGNPSAQIREFDRVFHSQDYQATQGSGSTYDPDLEIDGDGTSYQYDPQNYGGWGGR